MVTLLSPRLVSMMCSVGHKNNETPCGLIMIGLEVRVVLKEEDTGILLSLSD